MSKPIKDTFWTRLWWLVRGVLFYNTVYWKRASDEARPPRISQRERKEMMPVRDFNFIKPRTVSRAKIGGEIPPAAPASAKVKPLLPVAFPPNREPAAEETGEAPAAASAPLEEIPKELLKKRRYSYHRTSQRRSRRAKINPANPFASPESGGGLIKRLFGKKNSEEF